MAKSAKVAISLPEDVLEAVETERKAKGESRSQFFRRAIERFLKQERESSAVKDYVRGYQEVPESAEEVEAVHRAGIAVLAEEPWA
jgi:metal-responsive CopG/Arc/MetJ family transcriptional regulator